MADEATIQCGLQIRKTSGNLSLIDYKQSGPASFRVTVDGTKGPSPGAMTIPVGGKVIPLNELTTPGLCHIHNLDATNYVEYGIRDPDTNLFYPLGELGPGEAVSFKFSRNMLEEYAGTGTGTSSPSNQFFMKANTADCVVSVEAFEA